MKETKKRQVHAPERKAKVGLEALHGVKDRQPDRAGIWGTPGTSGPVEEGNPVAK